MNRSMSMSINAKEAIILNMLFFSEPNYRFSADIWDVGFTFVSICCEKLRRLGRHPELLERFEQYKKFFSSPPVSYQYVNTTSTTSNSTLYFY